MAEKGIQEQIESENKTKIEELKAKLAEATGGAEQLELDKHRLKIIDDIFTLKCPRCKLAFLDYDNCSAVTCAGCKCGFCSFCLEDCGKDAHQHFYSNGSKCPNEGGEIFTEHGKWQEIQNKRKGVLLCKYLATVPEELRKKVADLCAPDAKDLGVTMPSNLSGVALDPEAHGLVRVLLYVPRWLRAKLTGEIEEQKKKGFVLTIPEAKAKVPVECSAPGFGVSRVLARVLPRKDATKKNVSRYLNNGTEVTIDDEWVELKCDKPKIACGFIKAKHVQGRPVPENNVAVRDAGGHGKVMVRKLAKQEEGKNIHCFLDDETEISVLQHWVEAKWEPGLGGGLFGGGLFGKGGGKHADNTHGFIEGRDIPEVEAVLQGNETEIWKAILDLEKVLGVNLQATLTGDAAKKKGKGKGKGKLKGKGKGKGLFG